MSVLLLSLGCGRGRAVALAALFAILALVAVVPAALASRNHVFSTSFGAFSNPQALAVDQASGDVYVLDVGAGKILRFKANGEPDDFTAPGSPSYVNENALTGTTEGGFSFEQGRSENQIAVAPAGAAGGTAGDVYVTESARGVIDVFASSGEYLGRLDGSGNANLNAGGELCGVATDATGDLYLGYFTSHVDKYVPSANPPLNSNFDSELTRVEHVCNVAASNSTLYASEWAVGPLTAYPLSLFPGGGAETSAIGGGAVLKDFGGAAASTAVSIDPSNGDVYVDEGNRVAQFDSSGSFIGTFGSSDPGALSGSSYGLAVDGATGVVYVADAGASPHPTIDVFTPPPPSPPVVLTETAWPILDTSATLIATVDPKGSEVTDCHFEYGTDESYGHSAPCSPASPGSGFGDVKVAANLEGLQPSTVYHFRVLATNECAVGCGSATGRDATFTTYPSHAGEADCANQAFRTGFSSVLPDCRAYELVSTGEKNDNAAMSLSASFQSFDIVGATGGRLEWDDRGASPNPDPSTGQANPYTSSRDPATGWSLPERLAPPGADGNTTYSVKAASADLGTVVLQAARYVPATGETLPPTMLDRQADGSFATIEEGFPADVVHLSPDGSHVFFDVAGHLLPADAHAAGAEQLYEWNPSSGVRLAGVDSAGAQTSPCGAILAGMGGRHGALSRQDVSDNGGRVFFQSPDPSMEEPPTECKFGGPTGTSYVSDIYVREGATTVDISKPPAGVADYGASFVGATPSGSVVFFVTETALTPDKTTEGPGHADLYRYDVESHQLTRVSKGRTGFDDAALSVTGIGGTEELSQTAIASADGAHAYFTARGQLIEGEGASPVENEAHDTVNLYRWGQGDGVSFIATVGKAALSSRERTEQTGAPLWPQAVTPNGSALLFASVSRLTGYNNEGASELYRYEASTEQIDCVSCAPDGAAPNGQVAPLFPSYYSGNGGAHAGLDFSQLGGLSEDGSTVVFASDDQLLPAAVNDAGAKGEVFDVYEWRNGKLSLISTGTSPSNDALLGTTPSGNDIFFMTSDQLLPRDRDGALDIYDAHVGGGYPESPTPTPSCLGDECRGALEPPPVFGAPSSSLFSGLGNLSTSPVAPPKSKAKQLTRAQKLAKALAACKKKPKKKRRACELQAKRRYGKQLRKSSRKLVHLGRRTAR